MSEPKRYTITAALPYANGPLHIGHLAGAYIAADIYARYLRLQGKDVIFVCGSDEHGAAITIKAKKENTTPKEIVDKYNAIIRDSFEKFGISFDIYHRTSEPIHYETSQDFFRVLNDKHAFDIIESEQYFDEEAKQFLADRYIIGTCPKCGNENAYGDQCEKCGSSLNPTDLIHPRSTLTNSLPVLKKTKHWFLKLDDQQKGIEDWFDKTSKENNWKAHVVGQCKSWLNDGLRPRAMTRDLDWGIPVPPEIEGAEGKVLYVWLDAPIGYISATKQLFKEIESGRTEFSYPNNFAADLQNRKADEWQKYWQDEETELIHFIGKDNIVFHCITFPAILKATEQYILPSNVPANEFMNLEGDKISTSRNWAVWLHEYLEDFPGREDELRYALISNMPENSDSEFTWAYDGSDKTTGSFQARVNNELANNLGNFVKRVSDLLHKFCKGKVPKWIETDYTSINFNSFDSTGKYTSSNRAKVMLSQNILRDFGNNISNNIESFQFKEALFNIMRLSSLGNKFLQDNEPWKLVKTNPDATEQILYLSVQIVGTIAYHLKYLLPKTATQIENIFNVDLVSSYEEHRHHFGFIIPSNTLINASQILFERITDEQVQAQIEKLNKSKMEQIASSSEISHVVRNDIAVKSEITYDDFSKLDIRTGKILAAEKVAKADKLLKLLVDVGFEQRTIVSGIAEHFTPEEIVGKEVSVLVNLAPRKLKGIESNGMILMAEDANGKLYFVNADNVDAGNIIK
ncbi:MAG TPA: methionine--tRNA ligase [Chitinophagales bacterium]|nr:methionine--tRNA ligase [Chitinophagales bacterium]